MCGIAGIVGGPTEELEHRLTLMADSMVHRGPDGSGMWTCDEAGFSFRRLAIVDLESGNQPMSNEAETVWMVCNGEIYNHAELRQELIALGHSFRTDHSDVEVIVHGYEEWGESFVERLQGMFALAIWDTAQRQLLLARDRFGIKPLYYASTEHGFAFASEVKALISAKLVSPALDLRGLDYFLTFLWVPDPHTAFQGVSKLQPAHVLIFRDGQSEVDGYWDLSFEKDEDLSEREWEEILLQKLDVAVDRRLMSDVPVGAFLSGGLDSTSILASMLEKTDRPKTYTIAFRSEDRSGDIVGSDVEHARAVARDYPIDHEEIELTPEVVGLLPKLIHHMDEPVADPAAITTYLICASARDKRKVLLSGMGADEVFAGYPRHRAMVLADWYRRVVPTSARERLIGPLVSRLPAGRPGPFQRLFRNSKAFARGASLDFTHRYLDFGTYFDARARRDLYSEALAPVAAGWDAYDQHLDHFKRVRGEHPLDQVLYVDMKTFLPCLNLTYTDKMSMAASVEVRVPFLDHELVEMAARMPAELKLKGLRGKYILKRAMRSRVPSEVLRRRKVGFSAPLAAWLRADLRELVRDVLSAENVRRRGLFRPDRVEELVQDFYSGREYNVLQIWQLVTLELWMETFLSGS